MSNVKIISDAFILFLQLMFSQLFQGFTRLIEVSRLNSISSRLNPFIIGGQLIRWTTYGQEYQPSSLRRKRKFGFLARLRSRNGRKILQRRIQKGRKYLSA